MHCKTDTVRSVLVWLQSFPEERVVLLFEAAVGGEACLLKGGDVCVEPRQLMVDDGCFPGVVNLLEVARKARTHCSDIPGSKPQGWWFWFLSSFFAWCRVYSLLFGLYPELQAPIEAGRLWRVNTLLAGGCPA